MIGHIYCIKSKQTTDIYIGSTKITLEERLIKHESSYDMWLNGKFHYTTSFEILKYDDYYIELIETIEYNKNDELFAREGYYQRIIKCVNKRIECRNIKEWRIDNQQKIKQYRIDNKDKNKIKQNQYKINNIDKIKEYKSQKITCICGSICNRDTISRHNKTQKHITFLEANKI